MTSHIRHRLHALLLTLGLVAASACSRDGEEERGAWPVGTEWRLEEQARIGEAEDGEDGIFGMVAAVTLDAMGRVWVADGLQQTISVFDGSGRPVRVVGRKGGGPQEFGRIAGMTWAPDGRLWVLDGGNGRFAVLDTAGNFLETRPRTSSMTISPWPGRFDRQGRLYDVSGEHGADGSITTAIVRHDRNLQPLDTFRVPPFEPELFELVQGDARNRVVTQINVPFTGTQEWRVDPEGRVWLANTARYRIVRHAFSGAVETAVERRLKPVPVSREERDRALEGYQQFIRQGGRVDLARIPDTHPPLINFQFDDAGRLWTSPATAQGRALDVFEPGGRYLGRVALPGPRMTSPRAIRGDRMAVVSRDSLDVQSITLLRIVKPRG